MQTRPTQTNAIPGLVNNARRYLGGMRLLLLTSALLLAAPAPASEFECPVGEAAFADLGEGVTLRTCMLAKDRREFVRVGPLELIKNGILILKTQTDGNGRLHGNYRSWDDAGKLTEDGNYSRGIKQGLWMSIDMHGNRQVVRYRGGVPVGM